MPKEWYLNNFTTFLGFPYDGFYSTDYFSLFPWFFLFLTGFYLYQKVEKEGYLQTSFFSRKIKLLAYLGKHSLLLYLVHQPVIYGIQELLFKIINKK